MWILEKPLLDLSFLVLPALVAIGIFFSGIDYGAHLALLGFIVFTWVDSGHVFVTVLRTYMHREEYESNKVYIYAPIVIFVTMSLWLMTGGKFIWDFVVYATLHHNIKQFYGITRWYQKNISS